MENEKIKNYWEVSPPFKGVGQVGSLEWSRSISDHRYGLMPHIKTLINNTNCSGKKVLDLGHGSGSDLLEFAKMGADVTGAEITDRAREITTMRLSSEGLPCNGMPRNLIMYDGKSLPFSDSLFDVVYSCGVLHHTPYIDDLLSESHRVLKKDGVLKLMLYHKKSLLYHYSILYLRKYLQKSALSREELLSKYSEFREGCPYTRCFSVEEIKDKLWYFNSVKAWSEFCVYDTEKERKLTPTGNITVEKTGISDLDRFMRTFNNLVYKYQLSGRSPLLKRYGWHLLVEAIK